MSQTQNPVAWLIETTIRLCEILLAENKLLAARRPRELGAHQAEKETLSQAYRTGMETVQNDPSVIAATPPKEVARLKSLLGIFNRLLEDHRRALEAAKSVTERLVKTIAEELAGEDRPTHRYDRNALIVQQRSAYASRAVSLALDQVV